MDTKKRAYVMTEKRKEAFEKMQQKRREKLEEKRNFRLIKDQPPPIIESSSSGTDSSNYESDKDHEPIIINNYDDDDSIIKITKVKRRINKPKDCRKKILNEYFEKNKDKFCESEGEIDEIDVTKQESKNLQRRFLTYAKKIIK